jgi:hypothetical protein
MWRRPSRVRKTRQRKRQRRHAVTNDLESERSRDGDCWCAAGPRKPCDTSRTRLPSRRRTPWRSARRVWRTLPWGGSRKASERANTGVAVTHRAPFFLGVLEVGARDGGPRRRGPGAANRDLGRRGEEFVLEFERRRLHEAGQRTLVNQIEWTAQVRGDGAGYDLRSSNTDGTDRLIRSEDNWPWQVLSIQDQAGVPGEDSFLHFHSSTTSGCRVRGGMAAM